MSLSIGIVGLPNVGKSTLFNALLKQQAALVANYPFATIEPNVGVVPVPDERLMQLAQLVQAEEALEELPPIKPATVRFVDIAGLVKGAHEGEGLGNKFLAHIREVDLICHVLRDFSDEGVERKGSVNAAIDRETIELELLLSDLATLEKQNKPKGSHDKVELRRWNIITQFMENARQGRLIKDCIKNEAKDEARLARELNLLTSKKILYVINVDETQLQATPRLIQTWSEKLEIPSAQVVIISAKIESELSSLETQDQAAYLSALGVEQSGLERLTKRAYQQLELMSFLTAGKKEVKAWTIKHGTKAPQAAGVIHTDFEKNFIKAKVVTFGQLIKAGSWRAAKAAGEIRLEGREYKMQSGDVVEFMVGR